MESKVFFFDIRKRLRDSVIDGVLRIFSAAGFDKIIESGDLAAVKLHFGEKGNLAFVRPPIIKAVVDRIKSHGAKPFLTDCNVLYRGSRGDALDHIETAVLNGF